MTRYLTVRCTAARCSAEARVQLHGTEARDLPPGWRIVASSYDGGAMEFCSLQCLATWATDMQKAHAATREWKEKPLPVKPIDQVPVGAML